MSRLSEYFAHLVCKGVITRSLLKLILYTQYVNNVDTSKVNRRYCNESKQSNSLNKIKKYCSKGTQCENKSIISNDYNLISPKHRSSMVLKEDGKIIYGKGLLFTPVTTKACQDLTISMLYKEDTVDNNHNQNVLNCENLKSKYLTIPLLSSHNKDETYLSNHSDSTLSLCDLKKSYCYENNSNNEKDIQNTKVSQDSQYFTFNDHNSLRSSDSGLADITINQQSPLPATEISDSNSVNLCKCVSSLHINSCIFEENSSPLDKGVTFRSELYAHWWLKKKLPNSFGCDSGKDIIATCDTQLIWFETNAWHFIECIFFFFFVKFNKILIQVVLWCYCFIFNI